MTEDHAPFEPDELDELLSAELDGELGAVGRDFGLSVDEVRARIRATPGVDDRRNALAAARDVLGQPPAFDELLNARLRAKAVRAAEEAIALRAFDRRARRRHFLQAVGGIAAAGVLVVGVAAATRRHPASSKASSAGRAFESTAGDKAAGPAQRTTTDKAGLGTFSDVRSVGLAAVARSAALQAADRLGQSIQTPTARGATASTTVPRMSSGDSKSNRSTKVAAGSATSSNDSSFALAQAAAAVARCGLSANLPVAGKLVLRASAVLSGRPVVVLVFTGNGLHTVLIEDPTCKVKNVQTMR